MEIRVEATKLDQLPRGCYVSVRVGEVLKQGRYEPQRCYNFPNMDRRRDARIDLYQHVGTCLVAVDPDSKASHEVFTTSTDPAFPPTKLKVNVTSRSEEVNKQRTERNKALKGKAKDYLWMHKVEERLSDAVKALLKEQPSEPFEFLSNFLCNKTEQPTAAAGTQLPPLKKEGAENVKQSNDVAPTRQNKAAAPTRTDAGSASKPTGSEMGPVDTEELRARAYQVLTQAAGTGELNSALQANNKARPVDTEELRARAYQVLTQAAGTGELNSALQANNKARQREPKDINMIKANVFKLLTQGAENGELERVLEETMQESQTERIDAIRGSTLAVLNRAALTGELEKALLEVRQEDKQIAGKKGVEEVRQKAATMFTDALGNGKLEQAMREVMDEG
eukprot:TRINITY_DN993_c0_g1_i1.p1 TRINITY_DN993_c0_g1~~TRINITY_DN993_c0_g1_i1.p1  ORF type:complete len:395 (-),score=97.68 TRINITY_DN993_c0_g1_i1:23-1207(-)